MACLINITKEHLEPQMVCDVEAVTHREADFCAGFTATDDMSNYLEEASVVFNKEYGLFLIGGYYDKLPTNRVYNLRIFKTFSHWKWLPPGFDTARVFHSALSMDETIYISGGQDKSKKAICTIEMAFLEEMKSVDGLKWRASLDFNVPRYDHCLIEYKFQFYIIGGKDNEGNYLKSVEKLDPRESDSYWKICGTMSSPRAGFSAVRKRSRVYLIGGKSDDKTEINTISTLDLTAIQTTIITDMPPELNSFVAGLDLGQEYIYVVGRKSSYPKHLEVPATIPFGRMKAVDLIHGVPEPTMKACTSAMPDFVVPGFSSQIDEPQTTLIPSEQDTFELVHDSSQRLALLGSLSPRVDKTEKRKSPSRLARSVITWATKKLSSKRDHQQVASPSKKHKTLPLKRLQEDLEEAQRQEYMFKSPRYCFSDDPLSESTCSTRLSSEELDMNLPENAECNKPESYETSAWKTSTTRFQSLAASSETSTMLTSEDTAKQSLIASSSSDKESRLQLKKEFPQRKSTHTLPSEDEKAMVEERSAEEKDPKSHDLVMRYDLKRRDWDKDFSVPYYGRSERWSLVSAEKPSS